MNVSVDIGQTLIGAAGFSIATLLGFVVWLFKRIISDLGQLKTDVAAMQVRVCEALRIRGDVKDNTEQIIRLQGRLDKTNQDINVLHDAKRTIFKHINSKH